MKNYFYLVLSMLFWGVSYVFTSKLLGTLEPVFIIFCRLLVATILFVIYCAIRYGKDMLLQKAHIVPFLMLAFFEPFLYFLFETYSLKTVSPSVVALIVSTIPLFVALVGVLFFKEKMTKWNVLGIFISIVGIFMILYHQLSTISSSWIGLLFAAGAVISSIGYTFFARKIPARYPESVVVTWQNILGLVAFIPLLLLLNRNVSVETQVVSLIENPIHSFYIIMLAIFCSTLAFVLYLRGIRALGMAKAAVFTNLIPVVTLLTSLYFIGEQLSFVKVAGMLIVIGGVTLVQTNSAKIAA